MSDISEILGTYAHQMTLSLMMASEISKMIPKGSSIY